MTGPIFFRLSGSHCKLSTAEQYMTTSGFTFSIKKKSSSSGTDVVRTGTADHRRVSQSVSRQGATKANVSNIFESSQPSDTEGIHVKSVVTSLSSSGFTETIYVDNRKHDPLIKCKNRLPPPNKKAIKASYLNVGLSAPLRLERSGGTQLAASTVFAEENIAQNNVQYSRAQPTSGISLSAQDEKDASSDSDEASIAPDFHKIRKWRERFNNIDNSWMDNNSANDSKEVDAAESRFQGPLLARNKHLYKTRKRYVDDEQKLLAQELRSLPEFSVDSYDVVPVEEFGLAMLKGMGYDPKKHTSAPIEFKRRVYQHAGLGADKEFEAEVQTNQTNTLHSSKK